MSVKTKVFVILSFVFHQVVSIVCVPAGAFFVLYSVAPLVQPMFSSPLNQHRLSAALTETPGFPVQVIFGFVLGMGLGWWLKEQKAQWVWVLPVTILACVFIRQPVSVVEGNSFALKASYFFGRGCQPSYRCFDQVLFTLPAIAAISYSIGTVTSLKLRKLRIPRPAHLRK